MRLFRKSFLFILLAALMILAASPAAAHDTEPIRIYAGEKTALINPLYMMGELEGIEDLIAQWGDMQLFTESPEESLIVYASMRRDGALAVLVMNDDPANAHAAEIHIDGFREGGPAVPYHLQAGELVKQKITMPLFDGKFGYEFAPVSITLFVIPSERTLLIPLAVGTVAVMGIAIGMIAFRRKRRK